jgi:hypothetical protein
LKDAFRRTHRNNDAASQRLDQKPAQSSTAEDAICRQRSPQALILFQ